MFRLILVIFALVFLLPIGLFAQSYTIKGKLIDENKQGFFGSSVFVLKISDSSFVKGTSSDVNGRFKINDVSKNDSYFLKISSLGYQTIYKPLNSTNDTLNLGRIFLTPDVKLLKEITVESKAPLAIQNGDTTSYNSKNFKVNTDANAEDLVGKMPGVTIIDGKVQAQGEEVKQIFVDGKPFFGDDVNAALKNIPAEVIDKVQVFDRKSDQALFTGFEDANTAKTINIVTKPQFKNGLFGRAYAGYGNPDKYKAGATVNYFKENKRITVLMQTNNINEQNFSSDDLSGVMSGSSGGGSNRGRGGGGRGGGGGSSSENFQVNNLSGITTTRLFGLNYADKFGKKTDFSGSYFYNYTDNNAQSTLFQQYILGTNNGLNYNENNQSNNNNQNHRISLKFETKIDSSNSFIIQPRLSFQNNNSSKFSLGQNTREGTFISNIDNTNNNLSQAYSISSLLLYRHSFTKKGRTVSFSATPSISENDGYNLLYTRNVFLRDSLYGDTLDQRADNIRNGKSISANATYTEPISKTSFLSIAYNGNYNYNYSSKITNNKSLLLNTYSNLDSNLTNVFDNTYQSQSAELGYRYQKEKINFTSNVAYQWAQLNKSQQIPTNYKLSKTFETILPSMQLQYKFSKSKNLRINYRTRNNPPNINQLQDVVNNSNPLQLKTGNVDLKQDYQHNLFARYSASNTDKATAFFALIGGSYSDNYIGNSTLVAAQDTTVYETIFLQRGTQISRPVNLNGYYTLRSFLNYTFPITKIKTNLSINLSGNYSNVPGLINNQLNTAKTTSGVFGLVLSSNISEKIDYTISSNSSLSNIQNTLQSSLNNNFITQVSQAKLTINPYKGFIAQLDYSNIINSGLSSSFNQSYSLFNAAIGYKFLKAKSAELRLSVFDILNQNNNIQRLNTDSYIQDSQTNALNRYFLVTFTYNFRKYFEKKNA